jgi:type III secretory pathway component EscS
MELRELVPFMISRWCSMLDDLGLRSDTLFRMLMIKRQMIVVTSTGTVLLKIVQNMGKSQSLTRLQDNTLSLA